MSNWIKFGLTEEAQKTAVRAGLPAAIDQEIELPAKLVDRALDLGAHIWENGTVTLTAEVAVRAAAKGEAVQERLDARPASAEDALAAIGGLVAQAAAGATRAADRRREKLEREVAEILVQAPLPGAREYAGSTGLLSPETATALGIWEKQLLAAEAEREATYEAQVVGYEGGGECPEVTPGISCALDRRRSAERDRREAAAEQARLARLAELVGGLPEAAERIAAGPGPLGLLPEAEALEMVREATLPVGDGLTEYRRIKAREIRAHCECLSEYADGSADEYDGATLCLSEAPGDIGGLTGEEWETVKQIRIALAAHDLGHGEIRLHRCECDDERCPDWPVRQVGVLVEKDLRDGVEVRREYGEGPAR